MVLASGCVFGLSLAGCAKTPASSASSAPSAQPSAQPAPGTTPPVVAERIEGAGAHNSLVSELGKPSALALDRQSTLAVRRIVAGVPPEHRAVLRYALAGDARGMVHLVVYDGLGLPADGKRPGEKFSYTVFRVIDAHDGSTYDPEQNSLDSPVPPPPERDATVTIK